MYKRLAAVLLAAGLTLGSLSAAMAANPHTMDNPTGPPDVECEDFEGFTPGNSAVSPGAAFNPDGTGHNAYEAAGAESQYDVACFQQAAQHS